MIMSITENVAHIRAEMEAAALSCGRDPREIKLCAATKMNDADAVRQAIAAGVDCCGENRVQELTAKLAQNAYAGAPVHRPFADQQGQAGGGKGGPHPER